MSDRKLPLITALSVLASAGALAVVSPAVGQGLAAKGATAGGATIAAVNLLAYSEFDAVPGAETAADDSGAVYDVVTYDAVLYDMVTYDMVTYDMVTYDAVSYDAIDIAVDPVLPTDVFVDMPYVLEDDKPYALEDYVPYVPGDYVSYVPGDYVPRILEDGSVPLPYYRGGSVDGSLDNKDYVDGSLDEVTFDGEVMYATGVSGPMGPPTQVNSETKGQGSSAITSLVRKFLAGNETQVLAFAATVPALNFGPIALGNAVLANAYYGGYNGSASGIPGVVNYVAGQLGISPAAVVKKLVQQATASIPQTKVGPVTVGKGVVADAYFDGYNGSKTGVPGVVAYVKSQLQTSKGLGIPYYRGGPAPAAAAVRSAPLAVAVSATTARSAVAPAASTAGDNAENGPSGAANRAGSKTGNSKEHATRATSR